MSIMANPWKDPKSGIYYHRVEVPADIREAVGKRWVKKSLSTRDQSEAKRLFSSMYAETLALFEQARQQVVLTPRDIEVLAHRWLENAVNELEEQGSFTLYLIRYDEGNSYNYDDIAGEIPEIIARGYEAQHRLVEPHMRALLEREKIILVEGSPEYRELTKRLCYALGELSRVAIHRHNGDWSTPPDISQINRASTPLSFTQEEDTTNVGANASGLTLEGIIERYTAYKTKRGEWTGNSQQTAAQAYGHLVKFLGPSINPDTITREQLWEFTELLLQLPKNYSKIKQLKDLTFDELIEYAGENDLELVSWKTARKLWKFVTQLFRHAAAEEWIRKYRCDKITIPESATKQRVIYTEAEINQLFSTTAQAERPSDYWCPRIALATGMRSNEILQLTTSDIGQAGDVWYMDINDNLDPDTGKPKSTKTNNSLRKVPVPQVLVDAGFIEFAQSVDSGRLFPCVQRGSNTYSAIYGKRFNSMREKLGLKPKPGEMILRDFHSFRHTFRSNARAFGINAELAEFIGGWQDQKKRTAGDSYGVHYESFLEQLKHSIDLIKYEGIKF